MRRTVTAVQCVMLLFMGCCDGGAKHPPPDPAKARADRVARLEKEELWKVQAEERRAKEAASAEPAKQSARAESLRAMTPEQRVIDLKNSCEIGDCTASEAADIVASGATDEERRTLGTKSKAMLAAKQASAAKREKQDALRLRNAYASDFETTLFSQHMNPDGVSATGAEKTTLHVDGWFCSRQFIYDTCHGKIGVDAKALGFTKIECAGAAGAYWQDL